MKKIFYISIIALVAIISGCAKEENAETPTPQVKEPGTHTVVFHAVDGTKTAINEGVKAKFVWTDGDVERLTITENYKVGIIDKDNFSLSTGDGLSNRILTFTASFPVPDPTPDNYVYTAVLASTDGDDNPIVPSEQTTSDGSSYDPDADILVGTYESSDPATELNLSFYRPVAVNKMTLKGLTAGEVVKTVKITSNNNKSLTGTYDIINNSWSENSSEIIINTSQEVPNDANNKGNVTVFFTTMPVDGASLTIDVITQTSTATFFYKKQFAENLTIDFSPNLVTRFGVNNLNMTPAVAEVITGEERIGYATIEDAFAAANASNTNCTIKLLADCTTDNAIALNNTEFILNLNNHILTVNPKTTENGIELINSALTITDDSNEKKGRINFVYNSSTSTSAVSIDEESTLSINNGELLTNLGNVVYNKGTLIMSGGSVTTNKPGDGRCVQNIGGTFTLSGGNIESTRFGIYNGTDGTLIINCDDGVPSITSNSESTDSYPFALYLVAKSDANITGGVFSSNWTTSTNCRPIYSGSATGYTKTISGGTYQVKATNDISEASKITCFNGTTIIDINGQSISTEVENFITANEGELTIKDSSTDKGSIISSANNVVYLSGKNKATINIDGCYIKSTYQGTSESFGNCLYFNGLVNKKIRNKFNVITITNQARIQSTENYTRSVFSTYATIKFEECYISANYRAYHSTTGTIATIQTEGESCASFYASNGYAYYNGSSNTDYDSSISISDGYFEGKTNAIGATTNGRNIMQITGGNFYSSSTKITASALPDGVTLSSSPTQKEHTHYFIDETTHTQNDWYTIAE